MANINFEKTIKKSHRKNANRVLPAVPHHDAGEALKLMKRLFRWHTGKLENWSRSSRIPNPTELTELYQSVIHHLGVLNTMKTEI